ncbi:sialidase family protein [Membranihabitans marinus]|uniref:sialidase family protein n=1 Tax=Membranihabitans marinus TaxID=1227546 RepID=UPI001F354943|nr:sialidase family protein [Membranihabitans marinus]
MRNLLFLILIGLMCSLTVEGQKLDKTLVPGTVVTHSPQSSGKYIGSPSIAILPNGHYVASHDFFGPKSNEHESATSRIFLSKNKGRTWTQVAEFGDAFWSKLFVHNGDLYFLGTHKHHGNTLLRKSTDGGKTWTKPTDKNNGLLMEGEYHCAPMQILIHNGRLWRAMESAMGTPKKWGKRYGTFMMSIPVDADLLKADNWTKSNILYRDSTYLNGNFGGWIEGNAVVGPDDQIYNILRVDDRSTIEEKAAFVKISNDGKTATFDKNTGFKPFPGGSKKFLIRYDEETKLYWMITNQVPEDIKKHKANMNPAKVRNNLALMYSKDLVNWDLDRILLFHKDIGHHGFQYIDWQFEGDDIIYLSRTAYDDGLGGAHNNHDANFLTFHRIKNFRK